MQLQDRDIQALVFLSRYFMLNSRQLRELSYQDDKTGRVTRRRLTKMRHEELIKKRNLLVVHSRDGSASPVFHLTRKGLEFVSEYLNDETILFKPLEPSQPQHLSHYIAVADTYRLLDRALTEAKNPVSLTKWINEDEIINPTEPEKRKHQKLKTKFGNIVCAPDAAFILEFQEHRAVFFLEQDRDTFFHKRVAARKSPGYRQLFTTGHLAKFPESNVNHFFVLFVAPSAKRRDQLRDSFKQKNRDHDVHKTYRFAAFDELNEQNLLFEPVWTACHHGEKVPLIQTQ